MDLFKELNRRNVFRVGVAYLLFAWVIIQVTDTVSPVLKLPEWTLALVMWISIIGFPLALFFAWAFELTPQGLVRDKDVDLSKSITRTTGRKIDFIVIGLLVIAVIFLVSENYVFDAGKEPAVVESEQGYGSIGVLPFTNMSNDPDQDYFSDGISEELLNALSKLKNLQVAARTSSFAFRGQNQDIIEIGNKLKVDTVLEGSVRKSGSRLRITAQLIDVENGYHLWSEVYDRELTDVFAIQDEITAAIVAALIPHLDTGEAPAVTKTDATNMSAYDAYLQGRHQMRDLRGVSLRAALTSFRAATDADPDFAPAWAARASTVTLLRETAFTEGIPREESYMLARAAIDRAMELDPTLAETYVAEGMLHADNFRFEEALLSLDKAIQINSNLADAWTWRSRILGRFGRVREARENMLIALQLDPHNQGTAAIAANLATDFYDPEFFATVEKSSAQFMRVRQILEMQRVIQIEPMTKDVYQRITSLPGVPDFWLANVKLWTLREIDEDGLSRVSRREGEFLMWVYMGNDQWDKAQAMYDELAPDRQASALNLEELSIMQASQGQCEQALDSLTRAHGGDIRIHGEIRPNAGRSNSNLALNRVYCLRQLGRADDADNILSLAREYVDTLRQNTVYGYFMLDAKLLILDGDSEGAMDVLEVAFERNELGWTDRYDPILRTLSNEPRFRALFAEVDLGINALRAELGMPPIEGTPP